MADYLATAISHRSEPGYCHALRLLKLDSLKDLNCSVESGLHEGLKGRPQAAGQASILAAQPIIAGRVSHKFP